MIMIIIMIIITRAAARRSGLVALLREARLESGGTTCLPLLVSCGSLQHYLSNTADGIGCSVRHF